MLKKKKIKQLKKIKKKLFLNIIDKKFYKEIIKIGKEAKLYNKPFKFCNLYFNNFIDYYKFLFKFKTFKNLIKFRDEFINEYFIKNIEESIFYKFGGRIILKSSFKTSFIFLYSYDFKLIKQWSVKMFPKLERRRNTKYNIQKMVYSLNKFLKINKYKYIHLIIIGKGLGRYNFLKNLNKKIKIVHMEEKTPISCGGCRAPKKPRK